MRSFEPTRDERASHAFVPDSLQPPAARTRWGVEAPTPAPPPAPPTPSLEEVRAQAYAEGVEAGRAELPWSEAGALRSATTALEEAARALTATRQRYLVSQRGALVDLAVAMAERLVAREIRADRDALAAAVERAVALRSDGDGVVVRFHPDDLAVVEAGLAPELARIVQESGAAIEADASLGRGDVRVRIIASRAVVASGAAGGAVVEVDACATSCLQRLRDELGELLDHEETAA